MYEIFFVNLSYVDRNTDTNVLTPEVLVTGASEDHQCSAESPSGLLWSTLSPGDVFTTNRLAVPGQLPSSSSASQVRIFAVLYFTYFYRGILSITYIYVLFITDHPRSGVVYDFGRVCLSDDNFRKL